MDSELTASVGDRASFVAPSLDIGRWGLRVVEREGGGHGVEHNGHDLGFVGSSAIMARGFAYGVCLGYELGWQAKNHA